MVQHKRFRKKIGVDLLLLSQFEFTGVITYVKALLPFLVDAFPDCEWVLFSKSADVGFRAEDYPNVRVKNSRWMDHGHIWKLLGVSIEAAMERLDFLFIPVSRVPFIKTCPVGVVIHDVGFVSFPEYLKQGTVLSTSLSVRDAVKRADVVFANSEFTKTELCAAFKCAPEKAFVTGCGYDPTVFHPTRAPAEREHEILQRYGIRRPYILYLGVIQRRKNLLTLMDAGDRWRHRDPGLQLVMAGKPGWNCEGIYERAAQYSTREVILPGPIGEGDLRSVYQLAEAVILPSIYEGFGIPAVEAMACGVPTLLSTAGALTEVGKDAALYFAPNDPDEIAERVLQIMTDPELRARLIEAGFNRARHFTWQRCAVAIITALQNTLGDGQLPEQRLANVPLR